MCPQHVVMLHVLLSLQGAGIAIALTVLLRDLRQRGLQLPAALHSLRVIMRARLRRSSMGSRSRLCQWWCHLDRRRHRCFSGRSSGAARSRGGCGPDATPRPAGSVPTGVVR